MAQNEESPGEQGSPKVQAATPKPKEERHAEVLDDVLVYSYDKLQDWSSSPEAGILKGIGTFYPATMNTAMLLAATGKDAQTLAEGDGLISPQMEGAWRNKDGKTVASPSVLDATGTSALGIGAAATAGIMFHDKVQTDGEWDLKPGLQKEFIAPHVNKAGGNSDNPPFPFFFTNADGDKWLRSDVLGNVNYGIMAAQFGISENIAVAAANVGTPDSGQGGDKLDDAAVSFGYELHRKYPEGIAKEDYIKEVKENIPEFTQLLEDDLKFLPEKAKKQDDPAKSQNEPAKSQNEPAKSQNEPAKSQNEPAKSQNEPAKSQGDPAKKQDDPAKSQDEHAKKQDEGKKSQAGYTIAPLPEGNISKFISNPMGPSGTVMHGSPASSVTGKSMGMHYATPALNSEKALYSAGSSLSSPTLASPASNSQPPQKGQTPQAQQASQAQQKNSQAQQAQQSQPAHTAQAQPAQTSPASNAPKQQQSQARASTTQASKNQQGQAPVTSADLKAMHRDVQQKNAAQNAAQPPQQAAPTQNRGRGAV